MCVDSIQIRGSYSDSSNIITACFIYFCIYYCVAYSVAEYNIVDVGMINHIHSKVSTHKLRITYYQDKQPCHGDHHYCRRRCYHYYIIMDHVDYWLPPHWGG